MSLPVAHCIHHLLAVTGHPQPIILRSEGQVSPEYPRGGRYGEGSLALTAIDCIASNNEIECQQGDRKSDSRLVVERFDAWIASTS